MKSIAVEYRWFGIKRRVESTIPEHWGELTAEQLIAVAKSSDGSVTDAELLAWMCGIKHEIIMRLDEFPKYMLGKELEFMGEFKPSYAFVLKRVKKLFAPHSRMEGVTWGQFIFADSYYEKAVDDADDEARDKFIACLYLPEKKAFDDKLIEDRAEYVKKHLRDIEKTAISLNYRLVKEWITERYPFIFQKQDDVKEAERAKKAKGTSWVKIHESIVGDDIINSDKYAKLPMHTVLRFLTSKIKEYARK